MGTDFFTAQFKEDELRKKYQNYFAPAAKVWIGSRGSEENLAQIAGVQIENIRISLNLTDAASASVTLTDIYDLQSRCVKSDLTKRLTMGKLIKIELGYGSELEDIFYGFVYEISTQFGDIPSVQITAMDVKRLMMDNYREFYSWEEKKYSEIFKEIMQEYSSLVSEISTDTGAEEQKSGLIQRGSDLQMVKRLCMLANKRFIVWGGKAKFTEKDEKKPITELSWSKELISFSQSRSYINTKIQVWGNLKGSSEKNVQERTVSSLSSGESGGQKITTSIISLTDIKNIKELETRADEEEEFLKERIQTASGSCVGIPVLIPGRYVTVNGLDDSINGEYYLKSVSHSFGTDGFTTDLTFGGKK